MLSWHASCGLCNQSLTGKYLQPIAIQTLYQNELDLGIDQLAEACKFTENGDELAHHAAAYTAESMSLTQLRE